MMTTKELQDQIIKLKKENDVCILAHAYQTQDILEVADFVGDSYGLSVEAMHAPQKNILMCGVHFMAETAKILSPDKRVFVSHADAGCPMAEQMTAAELRELKKQYPNAVTVAYINTTAELKTECDVCVTSSSALKIVQNIKSDEILFIPDCNLGGWVAEQVPDKKFHFIKGGCPVHMQITKEDILEARRRHPHAKILVHPECLAEVTNNADYAGSTTGILSYVEKSCDREFVIGTENAIVQHLKFSCPDKKIYALSKNCLCKDMKLTTLADIYDCVSMQGGEEIIMSDELIAKAGRCIKAMMELGK